jgi:uncharacterized protein CbrC (UPF0167 family)
MNDILRPAFGQDPTKVKPPVQIPLGIRLGNAPTAIECQNCGQVRNVGIFVSLYNQEILVCMWCLGTGILKYQEMHPEQTFVDFDVNIDANKMNETIEKACKNFPEVGEGKVTDIVKFVVKGL